MTTNTLNPKHWIDRYADHLYHYAIARVYNSEIAEDLIQDCFLSAYKARESFKGESTERTWLFAILKRKIIDHYRKRASKPTPLSLEEERSMDSGGYFSLEEGKEGKWSEEHRPNKWGINPETELESKEFYEIFLKCMAYLPDKWRAVFSMRNLEDISSKEVCKELNISSSNLWVIMHRARLQLRECLEDNWIEKLK